MKTLSMWMTMPPFVCIFVMSFVSFHQEKKINNTISSLTYCCLISCVSLWKPTRATIDQHFHLQTRAHARTVTLLPLPSSSILSSPDCLPPISALQNSVVISLLFISLSCWKPAVAWLMNADSERRNKDAWCKWHGSSVMSWCLYVFTSCAFHSKPCFCRSACEP